MINLNDYYLHPLKGRYVVPGLKLLHYWPDNTGKIMPHAVTVTKVNKIFGAVMSYSYTESFDGGIGWCGGGIDAVIQVVPKEDIGG